jgi:hypothetical protein
MAVLEAGGKPLLDLVGVLPHAYAIAARCPIA